MKQAELYVILTNYIKKFMGLTSNWLNLMKIVVYVYQNFVPEIVSY